MTYRNEMLKAVKSVLAPLGYKYNSRIYAHTKSFDIDINHQIRYSIESHFRTRYFYLGFAIQVISKSLNEIVYEVTDGMIDWRNSSLGPVFQTHLDVTNEIYTEFCGERPMTENISNLMNVYDRMIVPIFKKYTTQQSIYTCAIHDEMAVKYNLYGCYFVPLAYYFEGKFDETIKYIDDFIEAKRKRKLERPDLKTLDEPIAIFTAYRKNLLQWIKEKRTFKVDSEYLPVFPEKTDTSSKQVLGRVLDFLKKKEE